MTKERLLLCPEFSYVGGAVAPIAEKTLGMTSTGLLYNSEWGYLSFISSLAQTMEFKLQNKTAKQFKIFIFSPPNK